MPIAALAVPAITSALGAAGLGTGLATAGGLLGGAALGAGAGAGLGALTGQGAGRGALIGGASTVGAEAGGAIGSLAGFPGIGSAVGGALGGAAGGAIGGGSPITGGIEGLAFGLPSPVSGAGTFGGGIGTAVPAEATSGAVQAMGTPVATEASMTGGTQLASDLLKSPDFGFSDTGGGVGNISPLDVTEGGLGPGANWRGPVQMDIATQQPVYAGGVQTGTTTTPGLVGPQGGVMTPPADATTGATPSPAGATGTTWWGEPVTNVQGLPQTDPNVTWYNQPFNPGEEAYNAAPGASRGVLGSIADMIKSPAGLGGLATAGAGLYQMINAKRQMANELRPLQTAATGAGGMATALAAPSMTGVLPVGAQQALDNQRRKRYAVIEAQNRATGMSGSTQEMEQKQQAEADIATQQFGIEQDLLKGAYNYSALQSTDLTNILREQQAQDQNYAAALTNFVRGLASLGGTPRSTTTTTTSTV